MLKRTCLGASLLAPHTGADRGFAVAVDKLFRLIFGALINLCIFLFIMDEQQLQTKY